MTPAEALSYAILAMNTMEHPDATSQEDLDKLDLHFEEVIATLVEMRNSLAPEQGLKSL